MRDSQSVVAIDDEIIGWLARHERHVDCGKRHGFSENRSQGRARSLAVGQAALAPSTLRLNPLTFRVFDS
jgi:hypothetical protein